MNGAGGPPRAAGPGTAWRGARRLPRAAAFLLAAAALAAAACGGGGTKSDGPLPAISEAKAERDITSDGAATLTSTVTVRFDRTASFAESRVPLASFFEFAIDLGDGQSKRVLVRRAEHSKENARLVTLTVDALIPDGAELRLEKRAFEPGAEGRITARVAGELSGALTVLASLPLVPVNPAFAAQVTTAPLADADRDPAAVRTLLETHLKERGSPAELVTRALARYDSLPATVPAPKARAALAALTGTFAEPAIDSLVTGGNCTTKPANRIVFAEIPEAPSLAARVTFAADGARIVRIRPDLEGERLEYLVPLFAHEAVHCDRFDGRFEEVAATGFDTLLYLFLLAAFPDLAEGTTTLAREYNLLAVAMMNSGRRYPEGPGLLKSAGVTQALPGTNAPYPSFGDFVVAKYDGVTGDRTPDEPLAQAYLRNLAGPLGLPENSAFNLAYLDLLVSKSLPFEAFPAILGALGLTPG